MQSNNWRHPPIPGWCILRIYKNIYVISDVSETNYCTGIQIIDRTSHCLCERKPLAPLIHYSPYFELKAVGDQSFCSVGLGSGTRFYTLFVLVLEPIITPLLSLPLSSLLFSISHLFCWFLFVLTFFTTTSVALKRKQNRAENSTRGSMLKTPPQ